MKKILIFFLILLGAASSAPTEAHAARFCVSGFDSAKTVQVRVLDLTSATTLQDWTSTGVTESTNGQGKSTYCHAATTPTDCHDLLIDWQDNSSPIRTASEPVSNFDCPNASVVLPVMQGQVYTAVASQSREVVIIRGDTPRITFDLGADYTGWTPKFGAKAKPKDSAYIIAVREATWTDATKGQGYVDLTAADTATSRTLFGELELVNGDQHLTAMKFTLKIIEDVIR